MYMTVMSMLSAHIHRPLSLFFFNDTATTDIYTLSLHDALPISFDGVLGAWRHAWRNVVAPVGSRAVRGVGSVRSEEHTSELQSQSNLVCRLLLEKKKTHSLPLPLIPPSRSDTLPEEEPQSS